MKRVLYFVLVLGLLLQLGFTSNPAIASEGSPAILSAQDTAQEGADGMAGYPEPSQPIPYNHPGHKSTMGVNTRAQLAQTYQTWASAYRGLAPASIQEGFQPTAEIDPLASNYTLVNWDQLAIVSPAVASPYNQKVDTYNASKMLPDPNHPETNVVTIQDKPDLSYTHVNSTKGYSKTEAGDINGDGIDEVVVATAYTAGVPNMTTPTPLDQVQVGNLGDKRFNKGAVAVASPAVGVKWLFARGYDDQLWALKGADWTPLGGTLVSAPAAVSTADNQVKVVVLGYDAAMMPSMFSCLVEASTTACAWTSLGRPADGDGQFVGDPAAMAPEAGSEPDIFVRGSDNSLWYCAACSGASHTWNNLGGYIISSPSAARTGGEIRVVAAGTDTAIWTTACARSCAAKASWSPWSSLLGGFFYSPAIVSYGNGFYDVYAIGGGHILHVQPFRNGQWYGWYQNWANVYSYAAPAVTMERGGSRAYLVYPGKNSNNTANPDRRGIYLSSRETVNDPYVEFALQPDLPNWSAAQAIATPFTDFSLGHFLANGRMQMITYAMVNAGTSYKLRLNFYKFFGGFLPVKINSAVIEPTMGAQAANANAGLWDEAGDFDGDGADELALLVNSNRHAYLYIIKLNSDGTILAQQNREVPYRPNLPAQTNSNYFLMSHGNYDAASEQQAGDEVAVLVGHDVSPYGDGKARLDIYKITGEYSATPGAITIDKLTDSEADGSDPIAWNYNIYYAENFGVSDYGMASGNFVEEADNTTAADEIAIAGTQFSGPVYAMYDDTLRTRVYRLDGLKITRVGGSDTKPDPAKNMSHHSYPQMGDNQVIVRAVDLDRNGVQEVAVYYEMPSGYEEPTGYKQILYYKWTADGWDQTERGTDRINDNNNFRPILGTFVAGNFNGLGLKVGKPSFRLIKNQGNLVARLYAPPRLYDGATLLNGDSYVKYTSISTQEKQISVSMKHSWNLDATGFISAGKPDQNYVKVSLGLSVGQDFQNIDTGTNTITISEDLTGAQYDVLVYSLTDTQLFEYPVIDGADGTQASLLVTWPKIRDPNLPPARIAMDDSAGCNVLFDADHEVNSPLSFPSFGDLKSKSLFGYPGNPLEVGKPSTGDPGFSIGFEQSNIHSHSMTTHWGVSLTVEGQGCSGVQVCLGGSLKGAYNGEHVSADSTSITNAIEISGKYAATPDQYRHYIQPVIYTDEKGVLVVNYEIFGGLTGTDDWGSWWKGAGLYAYPDVTFIRPWYGYDCARKQTPNMEAISPEITFYRPGSDTPTQVIETGYPVQVKARVHNHSLTGTGTSVKIGFYQGDPDAGAALLCTGTTSAAIPARGSLEASCTFTASGYGDQHIYAKADPDNTIAERDEVSTTDAYGSNNKAFGYLTIAVPYEIGSDPESQALSAVIAQAEGGVGLELGVGDNPSAAAGMLSSFGTLDPGTQSAKTGRLLEAATQGGLKTAVFIPYGGMPDGALTVMRLEPYGRFPRTFRLLAAQRGENGGWTYLPAPNPEHPELEVPYAIGSANHSTPPALATVQYAQSDLIPGNMDEAALKLYYWNEKAHAWEDITTSCGPVTRDTVNNVLQAPICKAGIYGMASTPNMPPPGYATYLPAAGR